MNFLFVVVIFTHTALAADYKVGCYYTSWSGSVKQPWAYGTQNLDPNMCTHIFYAFAVLDKNSLELVPFESSDESHGYKNIIDLKKKNANLKVLLSLGGWTDSNDGTGKYAKLVQSSSKRQNFIKKAAAYLQKYKFDGLDIDWEYPTDKKNFVTFLQEMNREFKDKNLLMSAAVSADSDTIDSAYDVPALSKYLDMINVMTYDYAEGSKVTAENAPIDASKESIQYWLDKGASPGKIIVGIPFYGASFLLKDSLKNGLGAPASKGKAGPYTDEPGKLAYFEICTQSGLTVKSDPSKGVYAYKSDQWVGYDGPKTVDTKCQYVKSKKLGGAMMWDLSQDDFRGVCCNVKSPLLNVMNNVLTGNGKSASSMSCK